MRLLRFAGLAVGLAGMVRVTWALRAESRLPMGELLRRELGAASRVAGSVAACAVAGVVLVVAPVAWLLATGRASLTVDARVLDGAAVAVALTIAVKVLLVLFEELIFRAGVIRTFSSRVGVPGALVLGAAAFAAAHGRDALGSAVLFVDGVGFGVAYVVTGSLRASIAWHAAKNLAVWLLVGRSTVEFAASPFRLASTGSGAAGSHPAELIAAVVIVTITSVWLARRAAGRGGMATRAARVSRATIDGNMNPT